MAADIESILSGLNDAQREAVKHSGAPLLVVAGAGSGKTRVVTRRVAHLVASGVPPGRILAITFTNKAAGEMRGRVEALIGRSGSWISTFHSMCARILRSEIHRLGWSRDFSIYDREDTLRALKAAIAEAGLPSSRWRPEPLCAAISSYKNDLVGPDEAPESDYYGRVVAEVYRNYAEACRRNNALDFDDLLVMLVRLLEGSPEVAAHWRERFEQILIDEYQDTNRAQYRIAKALASGGAGLCAVGDPDQSIYGWRGADIRNILEFQKDFPGTRIIRLEENYRSTAVILAAASGLIANNVQRIERGLRSTKESPHKVATVVRSDDELDAAEVASTIERLRNEESRSYRDFAVFYRTNAQSRAFEDVFVLRSVPYAVVGSVAFYQRKEVKDAIAYLRLIANPADDLAFTRVVNTPPRGIGDRTVEALRAAARAAGVSLARAVETEEIRSKFPNRARESLAAFARLIGTLRGLAEKPVDELASETLRLSGYMDSLDQTEDSDRIENLRQVVAKAAAFEEKSPGAGLRAFLEEVSLVADVDDWDEKADRVSLMTLHSAKGLEFNVVFVTGLEEGLLPHARSIDSGRDAEIEEERRLLYVGMTRARERLYLTRCRRRHLQGHGQLAIASRFLSEIPDATLERIEEPVESLFPAPAADDEFGDSRGREEEPSGPKRVYDEDADFIMPHELEPGDKVEHGKFGRGVVEAIEGIGLGAKAVVRFRSGQTKKLVLEYARLRRV